MQQDTPIIGKKVDESRLILVRRFLPGHTNPRGNIHGSFLLAMMDDIGPMTAMRYARSLVVTAAVEQMSFIAPVRVGELVSCRASVNRVWESSMEVGIRGEAEDLFTGEVRHVLTCYMTFVGVDENGRPKPLPPLIPETADDRRRMADAARRMAFSIMERRNMFSAAPGERLIRQPAEYAEVFLPPDFPLPALADVLSAAASGASALSRVGDQTVCMLERQAAERLREAHPELRLTPGFFSLCMENGAGSRENTPREGLDPEGVLRGITAVLAAGQIGVRVISADGRSALFMHTGQEERAKSLLQGAGYQVG